VSAVSELVEFLRARLDDDEAKAQAGATALGSPPSWPDYQTYDSPELDVALEYLDHWGPSRALAEIEAKRRIVDEHFGLLHPQGNPDRACRQCSDRRADDDPLSHGGNDDRWLRLEPAPCLTVRLLALPYAGHEAYQEEWRP
jgi:hypothetical protein